MFKKLIGVIAVIAISVVIYNTVGTRLLYKDVVTARKLYDMMPQSIKSSSSDTLMDIMENEVSPILSEVIDKYGLDLRSCSFKSESRNKTVITISSKTGYTGTVTVNTKTKTATVKIVDSSGKVVFNK